MRAAFRAAGRLSSRHTDGLPCPLHCCRRCLEHFDGHLVVTRTAQTNVSSSTRKLCALRGQKLDDVLLGLRAFCHNLSRHVKGFLKIRRETINPTPPQHASTLDRPRDAGNAVGEMVGTLYAKQYHSVRLATCVESPQAFDSTASVRLHIIQYRNPAQRLLTGGLLVRIQPEEPNHNRFVSTGWLPVHAARCFASCERVRFQASWKRGPSLTLGASGSESSPRSQNPLNEIQQDCGLFRFPSIHRSIRFSFAWATRDFGAP